MRHGRFDDDTATKVESLLREQHVDIVVNFAAESHNSYAIQNPGAFFRTNVLGTQTLCEATRRAGTPRFHHISTCEVYGDLDLDTTDLFTEDSPYRPRTPYNASERAKRNESPRMVAALPLFDELFAADGYIRVYQDVRGKYGSEGDYVMTRPLRGPHPCRQRHRPA